MAKLGLEARMTIHELARRGGKRPSDCPYARGHRGHRPVSLPSSGGGRRGRPWQASVSRHRLA